jgi:hypothetical protein
MKSVLTGVGLFVMAISVTGGSAGVARANLVVDGGFEDHGASFGSDWTLSAASPNSPADTSVSGNNPHSGSFAAQLGSVGYVTTISQTLATTATATYSLTLWIAPNGSGPNEYQVSWNGNIIFDSTLNTGQVTPFGTVVAGTYMEFTFTNLVASTSSTVLAIGGRQDPGFSQLDDVDVEQTAGPSSAVPEPSTFVLACGAMLIGVGRAWRRRRAS